MASNAMYQAWVEVVPDAKNLRKTLSKEFGAAGPEAGRAAGRGVRSGVLGSVRKLAGPLAVAFAGLGIGKIIKDSIGNASDLVEAGTAITAVFGDADATIQKFAAGSAASLGQSTNQTLDAARVFGVFGKAAGLSGDDLAGFSTDFITLAADLASFNNTTPEAAIQALGAGLRGESEPLRQYGVLLDDAALKARATTLGIYSGSGALTQQQKVLAAQAEIMAQTGVQQGDFAKTSAGLANQQRILSAGLTNLSTTFGAIFLPIATTVVGFLNRSVVPAFQGLAEMLSGGEMPAGVSGFLDSLQPVIDFFKSTFGPVIEALKPVFAELAPVFGALVPQLVGLWQAFSPLSLVLKAIGPLLPQLVGVFGELAATLGGALGSALSTLMPNITEMSSIFVELIGGLITTLLPIIIELVGILGPVLGAVITAVMPLITSLQGIILKLAAAILPLLKPILALIVPLAELIGAILPPLIELFVAILTPIIALVSVLLDLLVPILTVVINVLATVIGWIVQAITWFIGLVTGSEETSKGISDVWNGIMSFFGDVFKNIGKFFLDGWNNAMRIVSDFGRNIGSFFVDMWANVTGFFSDGIAGIVGFFTDLPGKIMNVLSGLGGMLVDLGRNMIEGLISGAGSILKNLGTFFLNIVPAFIREPFKAALGIRSPSKVFAGFGQNLGQGLIVGVDSMQAKVGGSLASLVDVPRITARVDASVTGAGRAALTPDKKQSPQDVGPTDLSEATIKDLIRGLAAVVRNERRQEGAF